MAAALVSRAFAKAVPELESLRHRLEQQIVAAGGTVIGVGAPRIATIGAYAMSGVASASQLVQFDLAGISISAGSACSSGSMKASRVLEAMAVAPRIASTVVRVSFGPSTSAADIDRFVGEWRRIRAAAETRAA
jgi:cysteine desulfurase